MLAAVTALLSAGLVVAGLFFTVHSVVNVLSGGERTIGYKFTWWGLDDTGQGEELGLFPTDTALSGIPLVAAATLLVLAAVFLFLSGRTVRPGVRTAGRSLVSAGVGVLAGVTGLQLIGSLESMETWNANPLDAGESIDFMIELGLYLPFGGLALGLVAVVLAHRVRSARREPATPPMGFRMRQYGPGPMTGQQPALPGPGQSSGRFAPVPPPSDRGAGQFAQAGAPVAQSPTSSTQDKSTSDAEDDPDITQRTKVDIGQPGATAQPSPVQAALTEPAPSGPESGRQDTAPPPIPPTVTEPRPVDLFSAGTAVPATPSHEPPTPESGQASPPSPPPAGGPATAEAAQPSQSGREPNAPATERATSGDPGQGSTATPGVPSTPSQGTPAAAEPASPGNTPPTATETPASSQTAQTAPWAPRETGARSAGTGQAAPADRPDAPQAPEAAASPSQSGQGSTPSTPAPGAPSTPERTPPAALDLPPAPLAPELAAEKDKDKD